jgi:hypothetical protein
MYAFPIVPDDIARKSQLKKGTCFDCFRNRIVSGVALRFTSNTLRCITRGGIVERQSVVTVALGSNLETFWTRKISEKTSSATADNVLSRCEGRA